MSGVCVSSPTNSTMFTTCCGLAILDDQEDCPGCGERVEPQGRAARWEAAFGPIRRREEALSRALGRDGIPPAGSHMRAGEVSGER